MAKPYLIERFAGPDAAVREATLDEFFRATGDEPAWKAGEAVTAARRFQRLVAALKKNLTEARVYKSRRDQHIGVRRRTGAVGVDGWGSRPWSSRPDGMAACRFVTERCALAFITLVCFA